MDDLQQRNLAEIEGLNQRGGRTLSFVDLIRAGTMSEEMVAYCWTAIANGASFLTAARPGGAGKSTVLANLLVLLPPGEEIVTFGSLPPGPLPNQGGGEEPHPRCILAHEIGSGPWHGYIWGSEVRDFLSLKTHGHRLAACLHADTLDETTEALCSPPLSCSPQQVHALDFILFIQVLPQGRRVVAVHEATGEGYRQVFSWDREADESVPHFEPTAEYRERLAAVKAIVRAGETDLQLVRATILSAYGKD